jgi:hypothetical protein
MKSLNLKKEPGRCVHCLRLTESPEGDHVFPSSWYPDSTPPTVQRWTVPSCPECNRKLGQLEKDLLIRLVGSIDPKSEAISGLYSKAWRSLGIGADELPEREKEHREKLRARIRSEFIPDADVAGLPGAIPGLGPPADKKALISGALPIPLAGLSIIAEKIARGCEYKYQNRQRLVRPPYGIRTLVMESDFVPEPFASGCRTLDFGPGCKIRLLSFIEDRNTVWYFISIWNALNMHVRIELETELLKAEQQFRRGKGIIPPENRRMEISSYLRTVNQLAPDKE